MSVRARLLDVKSTCTTRTGQLIDVRCYQGTETKPDGFSPDDDEAASFTLEHPSGMAIDVTDLVERGKIVVH